MGDRQEQKLLMMWWKRNELIKSNPNSNSNSNSQTSINSSSSWEEQAFAKDGKSPLGGFIWPPRSYSCSFCRREFKSAQALGGHMNVHRRDRAQLKLSSPSPPPPPPSSSSLTLTQQQQQLSPHTRDSSSLNYSSLSSDNSNSGRFLGNQRGVIIDQEEMVDTNMSVGVLGYDVEERNANSSKKRRIIDDDDILNNKSNSRNGIHVFQKEVLKKKKKMKMKPSNAIDESIDLELRLGVLKQN